jgi:hypothetical protein
MTRSFLRAVARGLVGVLFTAQIAIAAYACPAMSSEVTANMQMLAASASTDDQSTAAADRPMAQMSNCDEMAGTMDASSPNLCAEHCKYGQQSDHVSTLNAPPAAVLTALYAMPLVPVTAPPPRPAAATLSALVAASPPHAILHCVHRI